MTDLLDKGIMSVLNLQVCLTWYLSVILGAHFLLLLFLPLSSNLDCSQQQGSLWFSYFLVVITPKHSPTYYKANPDYTSNVSPPTKPTHQTPDPTLSCCIKNSEITSWKFGYFSAFKSHPIHSKNQILASLVQMLKPTNW